MQVLIDADGCPVVDRTVRLCARYGVECLILCDTSHIFNKPGATVLTFDRGADSVDLALVNRLKPGNSIVITQDYGLAAICLARRAVVLDQNGRAYTPQNIDALLAERHESKKLRRAGVRLKGAAKRTEQQNRAFEAALNHLLQTACGG